MPPAEVVRFRVEAAHGIFREDDLVVAFPRIACGRLDSEVRRDPAQHDRLDAAPAQLQIEIRSVERAPLALRDDDVAGARSDLRDEVRPVGCELGGRIRRIDGLLERVRAIRCERDVHEYDFRMNVDIGRYCFLPV